MFKILLVSHGVIAKGFYDTLPMIIGTQEDMDFCCMDEKTSVEEFQQQMEEKMLKEWKEEELLVLADMLNGTPSRIAAQLLTQRTAGGSLICGCNLNLILDAYVKRRERIDEAVQSILEAGRPSFMELTVSDNDENE